MQSNVLIFPGALLGAMTRFVLQSWIELLLTAPMACCLVSACNRSQCDLQQYTTRRAMLLLRSCAQGARGRQRTMRSEREARCVSNSFIHSNEDRLKQC